MSNNIEAKATIDVSQFLDGMGKATAATENLGKKSLPLLTEAQKQATETAMVQQQMMKKNSSAIASSSAAMDASTKRSSTNLLVLAQVADDAQYGMKGLANQIPQLAMSLGMGAGLAGVVSIAALAIWKFGVPLAEATGLIDNNQKAVDAMNGSYNKLIANFKAADAAAAAKKEVAGAFDFKMEQSRDNIEGRVDKAVSVRKKELDDLKERLALGREIYQERAKLAALSSGSAVGSKEVEALALKGSMSNEILHLKKEVEAREDMKKALASNQKQMNESETASLIKQSEQNDALIKKLERRLELAKRASQVSKAITDAATQNGKTIGERSDMIGIDKNEISAHVGMLNPLNAYNTIRGVMDRNTLELQGVVGAGEDAAAAAERIKNELEEAKRQAAGLKNNLDLAKKTDADFTKEREMQSEAIKSIQYQIEQKKILQSVQDKISEKEIEQVKKAENEKRNESLKTLADKKKQAAKEKEAQQQVRDDVGGELQALRLQASGQAKAAAALREQMKLKHDAHELAKSANISEEKALAIMKEKLDLEKKISTPTTHRRIYKLSADESAERRSMYSQRNIGSSVASVTRENISRSERLIKNTSTPFTMESQSMEKLVKNTSDLLAFWRGSIAVI